MYYDVMMIIKCNENKNENKYLYQICTVYVDSPLRIFLQLKSPFGVRAQQVSHFFIVDLDI